ncbi:hypothetical protein [Leifsonia aquatica]|uniref:hypothetical protein n=1 Tax=Leifsonia aquatica TaxID=144185 RepID=UPI0028A7446D|nr:hypothetical protein [Leifsonia aquatica]
MRSGAIQAALDYSTAVETYESLPTPPNFKALAVDNQLAGIDEALQIERQRLHAIGKAEDPQKRLNSARDALNAIGVPIIDQLDEET